MKKNSVSINPVDLLTEDSLLYFKTVFSYKMVNKEFKSKRCSAYVEKRNQDIVTVFLCFCFFFFEIFNEVDTL